MASKRLTVSEELNKKTATAFLLLSCISQSAHGILNTVFIPPSKKPVWYDDLNAKLTVAKSCGSVWIYQIGPDLTGGVPAKVIDYRATFTQFAAQIQKIVDKHPDAIGADDPYVQTVQQLAAALEDSLASILRDADDTAERLKAWGIGLAPVSGGASLLVAGTGGALIIGGAVDWGIMQSKINSHFADIAKDQAQLDDDQRQIVALQGLAQANNQAIQYINDANTALTELRTSWAMFEQEIKAVMDKLKHAEQSLSVIVGSTFAASAVKEWDDAAAYAQGLVSVDVQTPAKNLSMNGMLLEVA